MKTTNDISVTIGGDFCPTSKIAHALRQEGCAPDWFVGEAAEVFWRSDLAVVNLECVVGDVNKAIHKDGACFRTCTETLGLLEYLHVGLVTLANNHIRDFGDAGVRATLGACAAHGIATVGSGMTAQDARRIFYRDIHGRRLAVINVAEKEFSIANEKCAGANPLDIIDLLADIKEARQQANHVLLIVHGGLEYTHYPSPQSVRLLRFLAEQGVTAVVRHHPHAIQGWEIWKGVPIFYSLGNLFFESSNLDKPGWFEAAVLELRIAPDNQCLFVVHGFDQCVGDLRLRRKDAGRDTDFRDRVAGYCVALQDASILAREWTQTLARRRGDYYGQLLLPNKLAFRLFRRLDLLSRLRLSLNKRLLCQNLLRCDAHREALLDILERE